MSVLLTVNDPPYASYFDPAEIEWYNFFTTLSGNYVIETASTLDTILELYESDEVTLITSDDDNGVDGNAKIIAPLADSTEYWIKAKGFNDLVEGDYTISVILEEEATTTTVPPTTTSTTSAPTSTSSTSSTTTPSPEPTTKPCCGCCPEDFGTVTLAPLVFTLPLPINGESITVLTTPNIKTPSLSVDLVTTTTTSTTTTTTTTSAPTTTPNKINSSCKCSDNCNYLNF